MEIKSKLKIMLKKIRTKHSWDVQVKNAVVEAKKCALAPSYYPEDVFIDCFASCRN